MIKELFLLLFSIILVNTFAQTTTTKTIVHFCDTLVQNSCGPEGTCIKHSTGNRCKCPIGSMGIKCRRPCQDIYLSCSRWKSEDRCNWARPILPFFEDNCGKTCGKCQSNQRELKIPLPPILEPISWIIGRWETETTAGDRFPVSISFPYREIFDITLSEVPMFDRPPVNVSVLAFTDNGWEHREVGFMTSKPFNEVTGFAEFNKSENGLDLVAIEMVSNTGLITIEEGHLKNDEIVLKLKYKKAYPESISLLPIKSRRSFKLQESGILIEKTFVEDSSGQVKKWIKRYIRTIDYLSQY